MQQNDVQVQPLQGLGPVSFGMSIEEVAAILGPPDSTEDDFRLRRWREHRENLRFEFWHNTQKTLETVIAVDGRIRVLCSDLDLFSTPQIIKQLEAIDGSARHRGAYSQFPALGLILCGFGKRRLAEGKSIILYSQTKAKFYEQFLEA